MTPIEKAAVEITKEADRRHEEGLPPMTAKALADRFQRELEKAVPAKKAVPPPWDGWNQDDHENAGFNEGVNECRKAFLGGE